MFEFVERKAAEALQKKQEKAKARSRAIKQLDEAVPGSIDCFKALADAFGDADRDGTKRLNILSIEVNNEVLYDNRPAQKPPGRYYTGRFFD